MDDKDQGALLQIPYRIRVEIFSYVPYMSVHRSFLSPNGEIMSKKYVWGEFPNDAKKRRELIGNKPYKVPSNYIQEVFGYFSTDHFRKPFTIRRHFDFNYPMATSATCNITALYWLPKSVEVSLSIEFDRNNFRQTNLVDLKFLKLDEKYELKTKPKIKFRKLEIAGNCLLTQRERFYSLFNADEIQFYSEPYGSSPDFSLLKTFKSLRSFSFDGRTSAGNNIFLESVKDLKNLEVLKFEKQDRRIYDSRRLTFSQEWKLGKTENYSVKRIEFTPLTAGYISENCVVKLLTLFRKVDTLRTPTFSVKGFERCIKLLPLKNLCYVNFAERLPMTGMRSFSNLSFQLDFKWKSNDVNHSLEKLEICVPEKKNNLMSFIAAVCPNVEYLHFQSEGVPGYLYRGTFSELEFMRLGNMKNLKSLIFGKTLFNNESLLAFYSALKSNPGLFGKLELFDVFYVNTISLLVKVFFKNLSKMKISIIDDSINKKKTRGLFIDRMKLFLNGLKCTDLEIIMFGFDEKSIKKFLVFFKKNLSDNVVNFELMDSLGESY